MTEREAEWSENIIKEIERRHSRKRHWQKVGIVAALLLAGAVALLAVGTLLSQLIHLVAVAS